MVIDLDAPILAYGQNEVMSKRSSGWQHKGGWNPETSTQNRGAKNTRRPSSQKIIASNNTSPANAVLNGFTNGVLIPLTMWAENFGWQVEQQMNVQPQGQVRM